MAEFTRYTPETASAEAKPLLETSQAAYGMIPNLHAVLAESPEIYEAYGMLQDLFKRSSLSTHEQHVVWLAINVANACHYCVPAHSFLAEKDGVPADVIQSLRDNRPIADARLEALRRFAIAMVEKRGFLEPAEVDAFLEAGFTKRNVLDVLLGVSHKVISNYTNHIAQTPVDAPFAAYDWQPQVAAE